MKARRLKNPPRDVAAFRVDAKDDDLVVFVWRTEGAEPAKLSAAEREILQLIVRGHSNREIADARSTSIRTVANQVAALLRKLGAASRYELLSRGIANGAKRERGT